MALEVFYKCTCMKKETSVQVPFRAASEDVAAWMQLCVSPAIYLDHRKKSPACQAQQMEYAKVPAPDSAPFLGGRPNLN